MQLFDVSLISVLIGAVVYIAIGFYWYSPMAFGKQWVKLTKTKVSPKKMKEDMPKMYAVTFISLFITTYVLAQFVRVFDATNIVAGAFVGLLAWVGFIATSMALNYFHTRKPRKLFEIDSLYHLIALLVVGAILTMV